MKTHFFKRGIAGLLSLVMCLSAFIGLGTTTAFAAGEQAEVYLISFPRSGDANLDYSGTWGHSNLHYMNGWYSGESKYTTIRAMHSYDGNICYCIEPGTPQDTGDRYTSKDETFWDNLPSDFNSTISPYDMKLFIGRIMDFSAFDTAKMDEYATKAKEKWQHTNAYQEYTQKNKGRSKDAEEALARGLMLIFSDFGKCKDGDPALPEAQALVKRLQAYISENYYQCTPEILQTLGAMYGAGGEFTENIDKAGGEGTAKFVERAISIYCK